MKQETFDAACAYVQAVNAALHSLDDAVFFSKTKIIGRALEAGNLFCDALKTEIVEEKKEA